MPNQKKNWVSIRPSKIYHPFFFFNTKTKELYLIQDLKEVDYIIKIDSGIEDRVLIKRIESIDQVSYRYLIDQSQLKIDSRLNFY